MEEILQKLTSIYNPPKAAHAPGDRETAPACAFEEGEVIRRGPAGQYDTRTARGDRGVLAELRPPLPSTKAWRYNQPNFHPKEQAMGKVASSVAQDYDFSDHVKSTKIPQISETR
jgi:hypothetical protein